MKYYLFTGITDDPCLDNNGDVYQFESYAIARCLKGQSFEGYTDGSDVSLSSWAPKICLSNSDPEDFDAIIVPAQKTLFSLGYLGAQDASTQERIKFLRSAVEKGVPVYYIYQSHNAALYNILHELPWLKPKLLFRGGVTPSSNLDQVTSGDSVVCHWMKHCFLLQPLRIIFPPHFLQKTSFDFCFYDGDSFLDKTQFSRFNYAFFDSQVSIPELSLIHSLCFVHTGSLESGIYSSIFCNMGVPVWSSFPDIGELCDLRYGEKGFGNFSPSKYDKLKPLEGFLCLN